MSERKEIYSMIYGGWGKTDVKSLVVIECEHCDHCSLYKNGMCAKIPRFMAQTCPFGHSCRSRGYSERAAAYTRWASDIKKRPSYGALKDAPIHFVAIVDDNIMSSMYAGIYWNDKEGCWKGPGFGSEITSMPIKKWTPEKLKALYDYIPRTMFGSGPVQGWKDDRAVWFTQLKEIAPDVFNQFVAIYPDAKFTVSHIGRKARLDSLRDGLQFKSAGNVTWEKQGSQLVCNDYHGFYFGILEEKNPKCRITCDITPAMVYEIKSEDMVDENTIFVT